MDALSGVASVIAVIQLAGSIITVCGGYVNKAKHAKEEIHRLQQELGGLVEVLKVLHQLLHGPNCTKLMTTEALLKYVPECNLALKSLKEKLEPDKTQKRMSRLGLRALKWPLKQRAVDDTIRDIERYKTLINLALDIDQLKATDFLAEKLDLSRLRIATGAAYNSYENQHIECLPGTRVDLLNEIEEWAQCVDGKCIFWLNGMAGTGKSTISRTVASRLKAKGSLGATFFFRRGESDRVNAKCLFPTLISQLIQVFPQLIPSVRKAVEDDPDISEKVLREQFEKLILEPLVALNKVQTVPLVVIIDALDECDKENDIEALLQILPQVQRAASLQLRFLLTSRPEWIIRLGFKRIGNDHQHLILHELSRSAIDYDIALYIHDRFLKIKEERGLPLEWPGDKAIEELVKRAVPLFISAATLCRFIGDKTQNPQKRLYLILADQKRYISEMDKTYSPILNHLLDGEDDEDVQRFRKIVGVIILLATPLSANALSQFLELDIGDVNGLLGQLHSVLDVPDNLDSSVQLLHLSFRDFLLDYKKQRNPFWIDEEETHTIIAIQSLRIMRYNLKKNICRLSTEGVWVNEISQQSMDQYLKPELRYSCRYWTQHLTKIQNQQPILNDIFSFLQEHLLHWLEVMSLLKVYSEAVEAINRLQTIAQGQRNCEELSRFLQDARKFIFMTRQLIDFAPLQLYCSGLVFSPKQSIIRQQFSNELPSWMMSLPKVEESWSAELQTLESHSGSVNSVAFSPNGQLIASASTDRTVKLWEITTGTLLQTLKGHTLSVNSVAFSPNGRLIASASWDDKVKLWEVTTGALQRTFRGHSDSVNSAVFSPDGRLIVSASTDWTIKLWKINGGLLRTFQGHSGAVYSVAFSVNGQLLASGSKDQTVLIWNPVNGAILHKLEGHSELIDSVVFSPDGGLLASASYDKKIKLWEISTGSLHRTLKGYHKIVTSVAFSPDGQLLASASSDQTVKLWETATGALRHTFEGHSKLVGSVVFSPDGLLLASASNDRTVKLWEIESTFTYQKPDGHSDFINLVVVSPDGRLVASASNDHTIKIWETASGALQQTLKSGSKLITSLAFSPDGQLIASTTSMEVNVWKTATGTLQKTLGNYINSVDLVAFSPDGESLGLMSKWKGEVGINMIKLWETKTFTLQHAFERNSEDTEVPAVFHSVFHEENMNSSQFQSESGVQISANEWVNLFGVRRLWLPPNYRPTCSAIRGNTVALGHASGRISFLAFRDPIVF
ncbi:hypothetical protein N7462_004732 [Penicillium macrosclerotiorum]|uniref:uncharacterized protein n=1 Tax=Penicillium macrosclerotiorum TaxID=303699 RepID=UPI002548BC41|nr:uncharacterized protein N7462_004732 [Penicillium macrosclerotiorum]KAJ5690340.1 hypothetical protein N7462_004732 [Penicillium macrosclerotiorum]